MATVLQRLIQEKLDEKRWRVPQLATASGLGKANLYRLLSTPLKRMPDDTTIAGLAKGLGIPEAVVRLTAAESIGVEINVYEEALADPEMRLLIASAMKLTPELRRLFAEQMDALHDATASSREKITIEVPAEDVPFPGDQHVILIQERRQPATEGRKKRVARKRTTPRSKGSS